MSVSDSWRNLPPFLIPKRLRKAGAPDARGSNKLACYGMGEGTFTSGDLSDALSLRLDTPTHGLVEPRETMAIEQFQEALGQTRESWEVDET